MYKYKVFIWWNDNTSSEFMVMGDNYLDAENKVLNSLSGTLRDSILSYYSDMEV